MNLQKADKIIKLEQELYVEDEMYLWILGRPEKILKKMGSPNALTTIYMNIQQRIVESQRRNEIQGSAINTTRQSTLPKTIGQDRR